MKTKKLGSLRTYLSHEVEPSCAHSHGDILLDLQRLSIENKPHKCIPRGGLEKDDASLMSQYSVNTDITTSSMRSVKQRYQAITKNFAEKFQYTSLLELNRQRYVPPPETAVQKKPSSVVRLPPVKHHEGLPVSNEIFPDQNWPTKRQWCGHNMSSGIEYDLNPQNERGPRTLWAGIHRRAMTSFDYHSIKYRPETIALQRNGLPEASRGDKSYQSPEYEPGFHKKGSTRPLANFGGSSARKADTHIPLSQPYEPNDSYREKEAQRLHRENTDLVNSLEYWRPATPLIWRPNKNYTKTELITQSLEVQG